MSSKLGGVVHFYHLNYINQLLYDFDPGNSTANYDKLI